MSFDWAWTDNEDPIWDGCHRLASQLYQADGVLSHENVARDLAMFLGVRLGERPAGLERDALLSVVTAQYRVATYLSCGPKAIKWSLAIMLRLALPYADHPDYDPEWRPG